MTSLEQSDLCLHRRFAIATRDCRSCLQAVQSPGGMSPGVMLDARHASPGFCFRQSEKALLSARDELGAKGRGRGY